MYIYNLKVAVIMGLVGIKLVGKVETASTVNLLNFI